MILRDVDSVCMTIKQQQEKETGTLACLGATAFQLVYTASYVLRYHLPHVPKSTDI